MKFSEAIRYYRKKAGLTQKELAQKMGLSHNTISMYETGDREPNFDTIKRLASVLEIPAVTLLSGTGQYLSGETETFDELGNSSGPNSRPANNMPDDAELAALLEDLRTRDDMRMLFKLAHGATPEDVRQAVKIIEALRKE